MNNKRCHYLKSELEQLISQTPELFSFIFESSAGGLWCRDLNHSEQEWMSDSLQLLLGRDLEDNSPLLNCVHPDDYKLALRTFARYCHLPGKPFELELRLQHTSSAWISVRVKGMAHASEESTSQLFAVFQDITRLKEMEACYNQNLAAIDELYNNARQALSESEMLFECSPDAILEVNKKGLIIKANKQAATMFGYNRNELLNLTVEQLIPPKYRDAHTGHRARYHQNPSIRPMAQAKSDLLALKKDGQVFPAEIRLSHIRTQHGQHTIASIRDISEQKRMLESLHQTLAENRILQIQSNTDPLTQIHNRRYFEDVSEAEFCHALRHKRDLSVLVVDIDHFKDINDTYGHGTGDMVLHTLAQHLKKQIRNEDTFARIGGEEFAILMPSIAKASAIALAERIRLSASALCYQSQIITPPTISIGVASLHPTDTDIKCLVQRADRALYTAKEHGRNRVVFEQAFSDQPRIPG